MSKMITGLVGGVLVFFASMGQVHAGLIWYNGDPDLVNGLANEINSTFSDARIYDDFLISSNTKVTGVFSNNFMSFNATQTLWEIRSGVSPGNGGTLVAGGTGAATQTANGFNAFGLTGYTIDVSGLNVDLLPGTYWLMVAPIGSGSGRSYVQTTSGANAVGAPPGNNGNAFWDSVSFGYNFNRVEDAGPAYDFSMGIYGSSDLEVIPEPSSLALLALGASVMVFRFARRRRKRQS